MLGDNMKWMSDNYEHKIHRLCKSQRRQLPFCGEFGNNMYMYEMLNSAIDTAEYYEISILFKSAFRKEGVPENV